jgi:hypothetical protein
MGIAIRGGIVLGILVTIWQFVMGITGWYKDPVLLNVFFLVILFEVVVLLWALKRTAPDSSYGRQVANGLVLSLVAGAIIICSSLVFTTIAYPHYFEELRACQTEMMKAQGLSEADIKAQLAAAAALQTPIGNALTGFAGTVGTALVVSAVAAMFWRKK